MIGGDLFQRFFLRFLFALLISFLMFMALVHVFQSLATAAQANLHVEVLHGFNDHHKVEAAFKACALALRQAVTFDGTRDVPSTKGVLG